MTLKEKVITALDSIPQGELSEILEFISYLNWRRELIDKHQDVQKIIKVIEDSEKTGQSIPDEYKVKMKKIFEEEFTKKPSTKLYVSECKEDKVE